MSSVSDVLCGVFGLDDGGWDDMVVGDVIKRRG